MGLKVAVQMDPIEHINIAGDSTFALMLEGQRRGHSHFVYEPQDMALRTSADGQVRVFATGRCVLVRDVEGDHFTAKAPETHDLSDFDVVLMRQDPPFDMAYITATHLLEHLPDSTLVVNDPVAVRNAPEKLLVLEFAEFTPPTLITRNRAVIEAFRRDHGDIILKPLYGHGGAGVFRLTANDANFSALYELFAENFREPFIVQQYLPQVASEGDKRIVLVDGELAGVLNRRPQAGEVRSNMVAGGQAELAEPSAADLAIVEAVGPRLKELGLLFAGLDVIGGKLTEINVTSPTGLRAILRLGGPDIPALIWDAIERKLTERRG